jgi:hypothetical protein
VCSSAKVTQLPICTLSVDVAGATTCALLQALVEIAQIAFEIGLALLVGLFALGRLFSVQGLQLGDLACNCARPCGVT